MTSLNKHQTLKMAEQDDLLTRLAQLLLGSGNVGHGDAAEAEERKQPVIELSLHGVANRMKEIGERKSVDRGRILVVTGAGISTAAGIPDFRSPGSGLYDNIQKYELPHPQAIFEVNYLKERPEPFFMLAKELYPGNFKPTLSHYFIRLLADKGMLLRNYTQNIDTLERRAGVPADLLVEAHGSFHNAHCMECHKEFSHQFVKEKMFADEVPRCVECGGIVKPDVVFFGESLPERFFKLLVQDTPNCDLLVVMGTSLVVYPFASIVDKVPDDCPRLLINREKVGEKKEVDIMALLSGRAGLGFDFSEESGYRDVFLGCDCDKGVMDLAKLLGWEDELKELHRIEHERLDKEVNLVQMKRSGSGVQEGGKQARSAPSKDGAEMGTGSSLGSSKEELKEGKTVEKEDPPIDGKGSHGLKDGKSATEEDGERNEESK